MTLSNFTLKSFYVQSLSHHKSTWNSSHKLHTPVHCSFHAQNPRFASLCTNEEKGAIQIRFHWIKCKTTGAFSVKSFHLKMYFLPSFSASQKSCEVSERKKFQIFHMKELELRWGKSSSTLTAITTGVNTPLETCTQATFSFSSASLIISDLNYIVTQKASDSYY